MHNFANAKRRSKIVLTTDRLLVDKVVFVFSEETKNDENHSKKIKIISRKNGFRLFFSLYRA
jgi:hypothetical protein